jgi:hypothetical protein
MKIREIALIAAVLFGSIQVASAQEGDVVPAEETGAETTTTTTEITTTEAPAEEEAAPAGEDKRVSVALLLGYGLDLSDKTGGINPYGLGFGIRGGYDITPEFYLGAQFTYFLGGSEEFDFGGGFGSVELSYNIMLLGLEAGYNLALSDTFTLRPTLGLGLALAGGDGDGSDIFFAPGAVGMFDVSDSIFVGLDVRLPIILAEETLLSLSFLATAGMRF